MVEANRPGSINSGKDNWQPDRRLFRKISEDPHVAGLLDAFKVAFSGNQELALSFLADLFTDGELRDIPRRWAAAKGLYLGKKQVQIGKELSMSPITIHWVAERLVEEVGYGGLREVARRVSEQEDFDQ